MFLKIASDFKYSCAFIHVDISTRGTFQMVSEFHSFFSLEGLLKYLKLLKCYHMVENLGDSEKV